MYEMIIFTRKVYQKTIIERSIILFRTFRIHNFFLEAVIQNGLIPMVQTGR
jgi:hypothetical protein